MGRLTKQILKQVLKRHFDFSICQEDIELVHAVHEGRLPKDNTGDPSFQTYAAALNIAGEFATQALDIFELIPFNNQVADIQEDYMPSYPPMSPVTSSFFQAWFVLDAQIPQDGSTVGELFQKRLKNANELPLIWKSIGLLNASYGSFYEVVDKEKNQVRLSEICSDREMRCWNSSGYEGKKGEVWYVRLLPPCLDGSDCWVTLNTPYVFEDDNRQAWEAYFHRALENEPSLKVSQYLKHGKSFTYWLEFVFQSYAGHSGNAVFLTGFPDDPASRPHSNGRGLCRSPR